MKKTFDMPVQCRIAILVVLVCAFHGGTPVMASETPSRPQDHPIALVGGTIHTVSGSVIEKGTVLFDKGKITAIGTTINLPADAEKIDVSGRHIYPGMVDARTHLGLVEIGAVRATRDLSEVGSMNPNVRAEVAFNPETELLPVTRVNGVTTVLTMPEGGTISGSAAAMSLDGWTWEELTLKTPVGMVVNWPQMTINHAWWEQRSEDDQKKSRDKALADLRAAFKDARSYVKAKHAEGGTAVPYHNADLRWEALAGVIDGKIPVLVGADEIQQIESAVAWADQENVKLIIYGGYDAWRATELLKARDIPVVVNPVLRTPWRPWEEYDDPATLPKKLHDAGIRFCIAAEGDASNERNLPYNAAMAASYGLPKDEALKSVTLYPAQILGIADRVGSLEVGKDATLFVTNGDPLEITSNVSMEFIQGKNITLQTRHTRLYDKYKEKYERLNSKQVAGDHNAGH